MRLLAPSIASEHLFGHTSPCRQGLVFVDLNVEPITSVWEHHHAAAWYHPVPCVGLNGQLPWPQSEPYVSPPKLGLDDPKPPAAAGVHLQGYA